MITISKKSWHYRLIDGLDFKVPVSLCGYFWKLVFTMLLLLIFGLLVLAFVVLLAYPVLQIWLGTDTFTAFVCGGFWSMIGYALLRVYREERHNHDKNSIWHRDLMPVVVRNKMMERRAARQAKGPNILIEFLRGAYRKVCPLLRFE